MHFYNTKTIVFSLAGLAWLGLCFAFYGSVSLSGWLPETRAEKEKRIREQWEREDSIEYRIVRQAAEAEVEACDHIRRLLKAPSTATFNVASQYEIVEDTMVVFVFGSVDSQNSYGAMLRSNFHSVFVGKLYPTMVASYFEGSMTIHDEKKYELFKRSKMYKQK